MRVLMLGFFCNIGFPIKAHRILNNQSFCRWLMTHQQKGTQSNTNAHWFTGIATIDFINILISGMTFRVKSNGICQGRRVPSELVGGFGMKHYLRACIVTVWCGGFLSKV